MEKLPEAKGSTAVLTTCEFRVTPSTINSVAVGHIVARWWWVMALPLLVFIVMGVYIDKRWFFLVPIFICLIYPFLGIIGFAVQTSTPRMAQSIRPHYLIISRNGIEVVPVEDDIVPDNRSPYVIGASEVADTSVSGLYFVVHLHGGSFLLIPRDSTDDESALADALDALVQ